MEIGNESPRVYIEYEQTKTPDPGYFKQILKNSLNQQEMARFCEYYIGLLNCHTNQHKERVMCLTGEPTVEKRAFSQPITSFIFLDEVHAKLMNPDDWKILMQGGLTAHDRKYKTSSLAVIICPMFITGQTDMDLGWKHNGAMGVHLRKFFFKSLTSPCVARVQEFLDTNAMDCTVWACGVGITHRCSKTYC